MHVTLFLETVYKIHLKHLDHLTMNQLRFCPRPMTLSFLVPPPNDVPTQEDDNLNTSPGSRFSTDERDLNYSGSGSYRWIDKVRAAFLEMMFVIFSGMTLFFIDELTFYGFWGNIMAAVAGVCLGIVTIMIRKEKESAFHIVLAGNIVTAIICIPFMFNGLNETISTDWLMIFALGVIQLGIPYILYTKALRHVQALDAILVSMIEPILNPFWVYIFIGEKMGEWALLGGVLVLSGSIGRAIIKLKLR